MTAAIGGKGQQLMTAKGRIHAIRLSEKIRKNPEFAEKAGIRSDIKRLSESTVKQ